MMFLTLLLFVIMSLFFAARSLPTNVDSVTTFSIPTTTSIIGVSNEGTEGLITTSLHPIKTSGVHGDEIIQDIPVAAQFLTITVVNSYESAITTSHAREAGSPAATGIVGQGTMEVGAMASFIAPQNWSGIVAINNAKYNITGDDSLIEASFKWVEMYNRWVVDLDVSYVNGFTVAISCMCDGSTRKIGCEKDLWNLTSCPETDSQGACVNPSRADISAKYAAPFFQPCEGLAWTFPSDGEANSFGECQSGHVTCCIGTSC